MKWNGHKLQLILRQQVNTVIFVNLDGRELLGISASYAADLIKGEQYTGFGRNGVVERLKPTTLRTASAIGWDIRQLMSEYPKRPTVHGNYRDPGAKTWVQQPTKAKTGATGQTKTIHFKTP